MKKLILFSVISLGTLFGAPPDCQYSFKFTNRAGDQTDGITQISGANPAPAINNKDNACTGWVFTYDSEGFSAISLNLQSAPNVINAPNVISQGTWSTYSGTAVLGSLPMTGTSNGTYIGYTYYPWIRVNLTSATGTGSINVKLQGWKSPAYVASLGSGSGTVGPGTIGKIPKFATTTTINDSAASDIVAEFSGTPNGAKFLRDDGALATPGGSISGLTTNTIPKGTSSTTIGDSAISDDGVNVTSTLNINAPSMALGNGSAPGLDNNKCGTAPSTPSATFVNGYCTSKIPLWKNEDGIIYTAVVANASGGSPIVPNSHSAAYTTFITDCNGGLLHPTADNNARTFTIDSNANVACPIGSMMSIYNQINTLSVAITSDTLQLGGTATTGTRTMAANCIATLWKITSTLWVINGGSCLS